MPRPKKVVLEAQAEEPKTQEVSEASAKESVSNSDRIYSAYVHGKNVAQIAGELQMDQLEVWEVIKAAEKARGQNYGNGSGNSK